MDASRGSGVAGTSDPPRSGECTDSSSLGACGSAPRALADFAESRGIILASDWLDSLKARECGNEHDTYSDPENPGWRIKATGPDLMLRSGRPRIPFFREVDYLQSLALANQVFGDQFDLLGVILSAQGTRVVICQPEVKAADPDNPHPTKPEINAWLRMMASNMTKEPGCARPMAWC